MKKRIVHIVTVIVFLFLLPLGTGNSLAVQQLKPEQAAVASFEILVDDFKPQPYQGQTLYYYNRLNGDRGALNDSILNRGDGNVTVTISPAKTWGGIWESLNHPIREGLPVNFSAVLPGQILPAYQSRITGITVQVAGGTPGRVLRIELKHGSIVRWSAQASLTGGQQVLNWSLPPLTTANQLALVLDNAAAGNYVTVDRISFAATTEISDSATRAFVWSYAMLLANWNPASGLVRDTAKAASGEFDAIQSTGSLAAATALAEQLGFIGHTDAVAIVSKIGSTLLNDVPRYHGLWPHWVKVSNGSISILDGSEWSSVDTVIAAMGLLDAQKALGLDTSATEQLLVGIDWVSLESPNGISHGYDYDGSLIPYVWDTFGGESWLAALAYASATGNVPPIKYAVPPTANGSGFIDELAWLFVQPPSALDVWSTNWNAYRSQAAEAQIQYYSTQYPNPSTICVNQHKLFGLSAAEVPDPSLVPEVNIYQAFGNGGRFSSANDGSGQMGAPVVTPHYSAMIASLRSQEAIDTWTWLIDHGYFSPLNNIESLMYMPANSSCDSKAAYNELRGSWNLALQTLGWGLYLAQHGGEIPLTWLATTQNSFLRQGYLLLIPHPNILAITRSSANDTNLANVEFTVTFSETVNGVNLDDFTLFTTGSVNGVAITSVIGSGATWTVTVNTGSGAGMIRLDVVDDDSIRNAGNHPLGGAGSGNGNYALGEAYTITKNPTFTDVPLSYMYWQDIEILYANGLTAGCSTSPLMFCPDQLMDRAQSAVFMMRGTYGSSYTPPGGLTYLFQDNWTPGTWARPWAEAMRSTNLTTGCQASPPLYCPWVQLPREQLVIFGLKMKYGDSYKPPAATGQVFADMIDTSYYAIPWAEKAYADGLIEACGTSGGKPLFCPSVLVTRGLGASVIVRARNLTMP